MYIIMYIYYVNHQYKQLLKIFLFFHSRPFCFRNSKRSTRQSAVVLRDLSMCPPPLPLRGQQLNDSSTFLVANRAASSCKLWTQSLQIEQNLPHKSDQKFFLSFKVSSFRLIKLLLIHLLSYIIYILYYSGCIDSHLIYYAASLFC